jgi:hypothetical protein
MTILPSNYDGNLLNLDRCSQGRAGGRAAVSHHGGRRIDSPRFSRIDTMSPRNVVHYFRLTTPADVDAEFTAWLAEAYQAGAQQHLGRPAGPAP